MRCAALIASLLVTTAAPSGARELAAGNVRLVSGGSGGAALALVEGGGRRRPVACNPLPGAWGLWVDDVDRDGLPEVLVALRKPARFDPVLENRLHVYALRGERCVPLWRGTRLAGRFERIGHVRDGRLVALERIGRGRRWVARYRWTGFGYAVERVLWRGAGRPPARLFRGLHGASETGKQHAPVAESRGRSGAEDEAVPPPSLRAKRKVER